MFCVFYKHFRDSFYRVLVQCFFCALAKTDTPRKLTIALAALCMKSATKLVVGLSAL
jgi:hypothetical protein